MLNEKVLSATRIDSKVLEAYLLKQQTKGVADQTLSINVYLAISYPQRVTISHTTQA